MSLRVEIQDLREAFWDFKKKLRVAKRGGITQEERAMLKLEFMEVVQEGVDVLGAGLELANEIKQKLEQI